MEDWENNEMLDYEEDAVEEDSSSHKKYLTFYLGKENYGIDITKIIEIVEIQKITRVPETEAYVKGVMNLRGNIIPVMDLRLRFEMEEKAYTNRTCIINVMENGVTVGLVVDSVSEVLEISNKEIEPIMERQNGRNQFIKGIGKISNQVKMLIDLEKLLFQEI